MEDCGRCGPRCTFLDRGAGSSLNLLGTSQCTEVRFASLLSGGFTSMAVINPPEKKLANRTSMKFILFKNINSNSETSDIILIRVDIFLIICV